MIYREISECPFCGDRSGPWGTGIQKVNPDEGTAYGRDETRYSLCNCGGWFQNPMPTDASLAEFYRHDYRVLAQQDDPNHGKSLRAKRIIPYFPPECGDMLDVGCYDGELMGLAKSLGWNVAGVEPNESARETAQKFGAIVPSLDGVGGEFDLVSAVHVLEHVSDPVVPLRRMRGLLRPGGQVLVVIPKNSYRPAHLLAMAEPQVRILFDRAGLTITMLKTVETKTDTKADIIVRAH